MLRIEADDRNVLAALNDLSGKIGDLSQVLSDIGETLIESTKRRFDSSTGPDGEAWAPNTQTTILQYLGAYKSSFSRKTGLISAKGAERAMNKKPLIGETRSLMSTINWQLDGPNKLFVGSPMIYAGVQQFGASAHKFGAAPWGDIPARPFLGISEEDRRDILDVITDYLMP